jgi:hypothetical protein
VLIDDQIAVISIFQFEANKLRIFEMNSDFQSAMPLPPAHYLQIDPTNPNSLLPPPIPNERSLYVFGIPIHEVCE